MTTRRSTIVNRLLFAFKWPLNATANIIQNQFRFAKRQLTTGTLDAFIMHLNAVSAKLSLLTKTSSPHHCWQSWRYTFLNCLIKSYHMNSNWRRPYVVAKSFRFHSTNCSKSANCRFEFSNNGKCGSQNS